MLKNGGLAGNFYALPKQFINRIRNKSVRFPIGTIGEDGLVGALAYWEKHLYLDIDEYIQLESYVRAN